MSGGDAYLDLMHMYLFNRNIYQCLLRADAEDAVGTKTDEVPTLSEHEIN